MRHPTPRDILTLELNGGGVPCHTEMNHNTWIQGTGSSKPSRRDVTEPFPPGQGTTWKSWPSAGSLGGRSCRTPRSRSPGSSSAKRNTRDQSRGARERTSARVRAGRDECTMFWDRTVRFKPVLMEERPQRNLVWHESTRTTEPQKRSMFSDTSLPLLKRLKYTFIYPQPSFYEAILRQQSQGP